MKDLIKDKGKKIKIKQNEYLVRKEFYAEHIYVLLKGELNALFFDSEGKVTITNIFLDDGIFGAIEAINNNLYYKSDLIAYSDIEIIKIKKEDFLEKLKNDPNFLKEMMLFLSNLSEELIDTISYMMEVKPIIRLINFFKEHRVAKHKKSYIAKVTSINERTLYRYLARLEKEGVIKRENNCIKFIKNNRYDT